LTEVKTVERLPLFLAVALTVVISLPFGLYLGNFNLALWASFIAWAEYFALGAKPDALKLIWPLFPAGALTMAIFATFTNYSVINLGWGLIPSVALWIFVWVGIAVFIMRYHPNFWKGSLAYFNGLSLYLAFYFSGLKPGAGAGPLTGNPFIDPWILWIWVSIAGIFGAFLGWLNIQLTFPKKVTK
jgi:hypothetical protein